MYANALRWLKSLMDGDSGVTAIEYGLLAALIAVAIIGALTAVSDELQSIFNQWTSAVRNAINSGGS